MTQILRPNQIQAINISKENDFESGIHYHATGTGKSWIAMYILKEYYTQYPKKNVLWICERKDILSQQFYKNCYYFKTNEFHIFRGLIASSRTLSYGKNKTNILFIGVSKQKYIEIVINGNIYYNSQKVSNKLYNTITCEAQHVEFI